METAGVTVENDERVRHFSDYFILESSREARALPVLTFDERVARSADVEQPEK